MSFSSEFDIRSECAIYNRKSRASGYTNGVDESRSVQKIGTCEQGVNHFSSCLVDRLCCLLLICVAQHMYLYACL